MFYKKLLLSFFLLCSTFSLHAQNTKIMLLGDSITYDNAYVDLDEPRPRGERHAYRNYLWYKLQDAAYYTIDFVGSLHAGQTIKPSFDPDNEGYPGWTSQELASITYDRLVKNPADIILLHIGSNDWDDSVSGVNHILNEIDRYEENYHHPIKVILARIINRKKHYDWIANFNKNVQTLANRRIANGDDIYVVDMEYGAKLNYSKDFQDPTHPNNRGYNKMANVWFNALKKFIKPDYSWMIPVNHLILF
jgi:hypothetical protein